MKLGELFAGYGGLGLAVMEAFPGTELTWYAEFEKAPSHVMAHHWPGTPNLGDVTKIDWAAVEPVDIISGGSPCQDLSLAGARKGMTTGTRSNLWESMREAIATIKPTYVVWENVRGALSAKATSSSDMEQREGLLGAAPEGHLRALGRVLGDLTDLGYDTEWTTIRASEVGAPHGRERVFVLATNAIDNGRWKLERCTVSQGQPDTQDTGKSDTSRTRIPARANTSTAREGAKTLADSGSSAIGEYSGRSSEEKTGTGGGDRLGDPYGE